jgi:hypothetical protein
VGARGGASALQSKTGGAKGGGGVEQQKNGGARGLVKQVQVLVPW